MNNLEYLAERFCVGDEFCRKKASESRLVAHKRELSGILRNGYGSSR
jgi:hypothetical protein